MNWKQKILYYVVIPILAALLLTGAGYLIKVKQEKDRIRTEFTGSLDRYEEILSGLNQELHTGEVSTDEKEVNIYILKSYALFEEIYDQTKQQRILMLDSDLFQRAAGLMSDILMSQLELEKSRKNFISGMGLSQIYVIEAQKNKLFTDCLVSEACAEVLKIDPSNPEAKEALDQLWKLNFNQ